MGYSKEICQRAQQVLDDSRARAQREAEQRRAAIYAELPQLRCV